jgi:DNA-directed RNA polymerase subunit RPC12/RpoP
MDLEKAEEKENNIENNEERHIYSGPVYECVRCGRHVPFAELERYISFRCPYCGYRVFRKKRAPIVKRVKAR